MRFTLSRHILAFTLTAVTFVVYLASSTVSSQSWMPIMVKNITYIGPQSTPEVTNVSRDGGYSVLINGNIVWLYDDTECMGYAGNQLSFISNTAAYAHQSDKNESTVEDFGVIMVGKDQYGRKEYAILADETVGTGGWIPFMQDELDFNKQKNGEERVAIWPGTSPTPISITQAFIYAPLVYVDSKPQDPSKEYQPRGMTLVTIKAPSTGPVANRQGDLTIPGPEVPFGGFATLLGFTSSQAEGDNPHGRDVYLIGIANGGLQIARVALDDVTTYAKYSFFDPQGLDFTDLSPDLNITDYRKIYLPGSFSSGTIFYSPYFNTFIMIYFNGHVDSTFYIRYLDIDQPVGADMVWVKGGKKKGGGGGGIQHEDAEALVKYAWSPQQQLYVSPTGKGGFNYAGAAHPEYFNRRYFAQSLYSDWIPTGQRQNDWYGSTFVSEMESGGDGQHLMLSWTSQVQGGMNSGVYEVCLAIVEFGEISVKPQPSTTSSVSTSATMPGHPSTSSLGHQPSKTPGNMASSAGTLRAFVGHERRREYDFRVFIYGLGLLGWLLGGAAIVF